MILHLNDREVEAILDRNSDGSKYVGMAYFTDGEMLDLTDDELDQLQDQCDDEINTNWRG